MTSFGRKPRRKRLRDSQGKYLRTRGDAEPAPRVANGKRTYGMLRAAALRLIERLESTLPPLPEKDGDERPAGKKAEAKPVHAGGEIKWTQAEFDRFLGPEAGVVDGFKTLAELIVRLFDQENERGDTTKPKFDFTERDEEDLDGRITAELDRLAERRRQADTA